MHTNSSLDNSKQRFAHHGLRQAYNVYDCTWTSQFVTRIHPPFAPGNGYPTTTPAPLRRLYPGIETTPKNIYPFVIGASNCTLLQNLLPTQKFVRAALNAPVETMKRYFKPKKVVVAERFHFHHWHQAPGETVVSYVDEWQWLAIHCECKD